MSYQHYCQKLLDLLLENRMEKLDEIISIKRLVGDAVPTNCRNENLNNAEVVVLYAGSTAKLEDIAILLSMSVHNLKVILTGIYKKMGVEDRSTLTYLCQRKGIVKNARNIAVVTKE
jgi:DNA-binding NarL/FixJ family response regulator